MSQPLAIVLTERFPHAGLVTPDLERLGYRVLTVHRAADLAAAARQDKPFLVLLATAGNPAAVDALRILRSDADTAHVLLLAVCDDAHWEAQSREAGATLVAGENAVKLHLRHLLDQALAAE